MNRPGVQIRENTDITSGQRLYVLLLVVTCLACAWLTVSAAILEAMARIGGAP